MVVKAQRLEQREGKKAAAVVSWLTLWILSQSTDILTVP